MLDQSWDSKQAYQPVAGELPARRCNGLRGALGIDEAVLAHG
jgi:hypothetical protein